MPRKSKKKAQASHATLARLRPDAPLTTREDRLILELLADPTRNQTQAAIRAGYAKRSAHVQACRVLKQVNVAAALEVATRKQLDAVNVTAEKVIAHTAALAFEDLPDIAELYQPGTGHLKEMWELTPAQRRWVQSIEVVKTNLDKGDGKLDIVVKVKLWDIRASKTRNLELLARHLAILDNPEPPPAMGPVFIFPPGTHIDVHQ